MKRIKENLTLENVIVIIIYIITGLLLMVYMQRFSFQNHSDDAIYMNTFSNYSSWAEWADTYYQNWSGRIAIHALLIILLNLPVSVWRVLVTAAILLSIYYTIKISKLFSNTYAGNAKKENICSESKSDIKRKGEIIYKVCKYVLPFILFLYLGPMFNDWVFTWCSGSANYLFPASCLLISIYPVFLYASGSPIPLKDLMIGLLAGVITGSSEQTGAIFIVYTTIVLLQYIFVNKHLSIKILIFSFLIDGMAMFSILAPGNSVRAQMELFWFPTYPMLNVLDKLILGMQHYIGHMYRKNTILFVVIMYVMLLILNRKNRKNELFVLLGFGANIVISIIANIIFSEWYINPQWNLYILWLLFMFIIPFYNAWLLYSTFRGSSKQLATIVMLLYLAAVSSCVVLGFSPTLYASGIRVFYLYQFLMYVLDIVLIYQGTQSSNRCFLKYLYASVFLVIIITVCIALTFCYKKINSNDEVLIDNLEKRYSIQIQDVSTSMKNGYLQVTLYAKDNNCSFQYYNWVNGPGCSLYLNAKMIIKIGEEYYILSTYPKLNEDTNEFAELRGYISLDRIKEMESPLKIGLITYDIEGKVLGYSFGE